MKIQRIKAPRKRRYSDQKSWDGERAVDEVLEQLGGMGRYQVYVSVLVGLTMFPVALNHLGVVFIAALPEYHCQIRGDFNDATNTESSGFSGNCFFFNFCLFAFRCFISFFLSAEIKKKHLKESSISKIDVY